MPLPSPTSVTVSSGFARNVAVAEWSASMGSWQVGARPAQSPDQPVKVEPAAAVAVSVTGVPGANAAVHVEPHDSPAGLLVTVTLPSPVFVTVRLGSGTNVAVAERLALSARERFVRRT